MNRREFLGRTAAAAVACTFRPRVARSDGPANDGGVRLYRDEMLDYFDQDDLFGSSPHPSPHWSGGNQLLETATALVIAKRLGQIQQEDVARFIHAIRRCQVEGQEGIYDKNPPCDNKRRRDQVTHDDMLAVSCASRLLQMPFAGEIKNFASTHRYKGLWELSNTGEHYWDALVKPDQKAIYLANAGYGMDVLSKQALRASMNVMPKNDDAGEHRLRWLISQSIEGVDGEVDSSIHKWRERIASAGGMHEVFRRYHGAKHVFTRYWTAPY